MKKRIIELIEKYKKSGPYYTSYPPESRWAADFSHENYARILKEFSEKNEPSTLYVHFPFCPKQCYYCCCRTKVTNNPSKIEEFLDYQSSEINLLQKILRDRIKFKEIHLGGGSPSFMSERDFIRMMQNLSHIVDFKDVEEITMEIDPRTVDADKMFFYHYRGVNRISFGVQDFNTDVQKAVNRLQSLEKLEELIVPEIRKNFKSINFDLIYGLPLQTKDSFKKTIETAKRLSPDRICIYNYDHKPDINRHQLMIKPSELPNINEKMMLFVDSIEELTNSGYEFVGIDHFAKPNDELALSKKNKTINRNFNGYGTGRTKTIIGVGPSGSGRFLNYYSQNTLATLDYYKILENERLPVKKGYTLNIDDMIRRTVIDTIICTHSLDFFEIEKKLGIDFKKYFKREFNLLNQFIQEGIIDMNNNSINITPLGRIFIRNVCSVFDKFLKR